MFIKDEIIIHPAKAEGEAHFDEVLATALMLTKYPRCFLPKVSRRNPTLNELANPNYICIDVGLDYDPELMNFDHHQNGDLDSSFILVARHLGYEPYCEMFFPWWKTMSKLDTKGPFEVAQSLNMSSSTLAALQTPTNEFLINKTISKDGTISVDIVEMLWDLGQYVIYNLSQLLRDLEIIENESKFAIIKDLRVLVLEQTISGQALGFYRKKCPFDISISRNSRNNSLSAYRYEDIKEKIDFSVLSGNPKVQFIHLNGFLLVVKEGITLDEMLEMINTAIK